MTQGRNATVADSEEIHELHKKAVTAVLEAIESAAKHGPREQALPLAEAYMHLASNRPKKATAQPRFG
jgi:replication-associated recombination protein RarA